MKRSRSQRLLKLFSVVEFLNGLLIVLFLVLFFIGLKDETVSQYVKNNMFDVYFGIFKIIVNVLVLFVSSFILNKVSKDPSRHEIALTSTLTVIAYEVISFISNLGVGVPNDFKTMVISVLINLIIVKHIEKVRDEYKQSVREEIRKSRLVQL